MILIIQCIRHDLMNKLFPLFAHMSEHIQYGLPFKMRQITGLSRLLAQITHQVAALQHGLHLCAELSKALQIPVQNRSLSGNRRVLFLLSPMHADDPLQGGQGKSCQILHPGGRVWIFRSSR